MQQSAWNIIIIIIIIFIIVHLFPGADPHLLDLEIADRSMPW